MSNKEIISALCEQCKAGNLPKSMNQAQRKQAFDAAKQARGWLSSSFFSEESTENAQHIEAIRAAIK